MKAKQWLLALIISIGVGWVFMNYISFQQLPTTLPRIFFRLIGSSIIPFVIIGGIFELFYWLSDRDKKEVTTNG